MAIALYDEYWSAYVCWGRALFVGRGGLFFSWRSTCGMSGEMDILLSLPARFFAFDSQLFRCWRSANRINMAELASGLGRWHALIPVFMASATLRAFLARARHAALVSSSFSRAAPSTPLITSAHFRWCTSRSSCRIAKAVAMEEICWVTPGNVLETMVSTLSLECWTAASRSPTLFRTIDSSSRASSSF